MAQEIERKFLVKNDAFKAESVKYKLKYTRIFINSSRKNSA